MKYFKFLKKNYIAILSALTVVFFLFYLFFSLNRPLGYSEVYTLVIAQDSVVNILFSPFHSPMSHALFTLLVHLIPKNIPYVVAIRFFWVLFFVLSQAVLFLIINHLTAQKVPAVFGSMLYGIILLELWLYADTALTRSYPMAICMSLLIMYLFINNLEKYYLLIAILAGVLLSTQVLFIPYVLALILMAFAAEKKGSKKYGLIFCVVAGLLFLFFSLRFVFSMMHLNDTALQLNELNNLARLHAGKIPLFIDTLFKMYRTATLMPVFSIYLLPITLFFLYQGFKAIRKSNKTFFLFICWVVIFYIALFVLVIIGPVRITTFFHIRHIIGLLPLSIILITLGFFESVKTIQRITSLNTQIMHIFVFGLVLGYLCIQITGRVEVGKAYNSIKNEYAQIGKLIKGQPENVYLRVRDTNDVVFYLEDTVLRNAVITNELLWWRPGVKNIFILFDKLNVLAKEQYVLVDKGSHIGDFIKIYEGRYLALYKLSAQIEKYPWLKIF